MTRTLPDRSVNTLGAYRQCLGEVDSQLILSGFEIADTLRREEERESSDGRTPGSAQADQLEAALVSELARDDFGSAMRFLKTKPDDSFKVTSLMRVVDALRSVY
jgi:hypothetical protein